MNTQITSLPNLKALFFDLDDVLVFSETAHKKAWEMCLAELGLQTGIDDYQNLIGINDHRQAKIFIERFNLNISIQALGELKRDTYLKIAQAGFESPQGRNEFLNHMARFYPLAVVSSCSREIIEAVLEIEKITHYFHFNIGFEDCIRHKPDPIPYQNALSKLNILPSEALVFEDSVSGVTAAKNAEIPVIGILKNQTADQILNDISYYKSFSEIQHLYFSSTVVAV